MADAPEIPAELVEKAAREIAVREPGCAALWPTCETLDTTGCACRKDAAAALAAALPLFDPQHHSAMYGPAPTAYHHCDDKGVWRRYVPEAPA